MTSLVPTYTLGELTLTDYPYSVRFGSDLGQPSLEDEPREMTVTVGIEGADLLELAEHEAALRREINKPLNEFGHNPGDGFAPTSVFDTTQISAKPIRYEDGGEQSCYREWELSIEAEAHARSAEPVTIPALPPPPASTPVGLTIDDCTTTTGWTATGKTRAAEGGWTPATPTITDMGDYVQISLMGSQPVVQARVTFAAQDMSLTPYLLVEMNGDVSPSAFEASFSSGSSRSITPVVTRTTVDFTTLYAFDLSDDTSALTSFAVTRSKTGTGIDMVLIDVHDVSRTDTLPQVTARQLSRIIHTGGTERTPASIHISSPDTITPLALTIVHTSPENGSGYSPPLQRWRVTGSGSGAADPTAFSGNYETINTTSWAAEVPTSSLPEGGYALMARLRCQDAASVDVTWSTSTIFPDSVTQQGFTVGVVRHTFPAANVWNLVPLALLTLPSVRTSAGKVQIALQVAAATPIVTLDEAWIFRVDDDCGLTIAEVNATNLWLDSPSISSSAATVWMGDSDGVRVHPGEGLYTPGSSHILHPDGTALFTASQQVDYAEAESTHFRRWHSNAAE